MEKIHWEGRFPDAFATVQVEQASQNTAVRNEVRGSKARRSTAGPNRRKRNTSTRNTTRQDTAILNTPRLNIERWTATGRYMFRGNLTEEKQDSA